MAKDRPLTRRIGFGGLGAMGYGMAVNLLKAGFEVLGFDVSEDARTRFRKAGGRVACSVSDSCREQYHYFAMVATPDQFDDLCFGDQAPSYVAGLPSRLAAHGRTDLQLLESPVSGGAVGAINGCLTIMVAGEKSAYQSAETELRAVSAPNRLFYCGSNLGAASTLKMMNQHLAGIHIVAAAETLAFATAVGLSTRDVYTLASDGRASSWILRDRGAHMLDADWTCKSAVDIFVKDLGIVVGSASEISFDSPMASEAYSIFKESSDRGDGRLDDAAVVRIYEKAIKQSVAEPVKKTSVTCNRNHNEKEYESAMALVLALATVIHAAAAAECCRLAEAKGVSTALVYELIAGAAGSSAQFNRHFRAMSSREFDNRSGLVENDVNSLAQVMDHLGALKARTSDMHFPARMLAAAHKVFSNSWTDTEFQNFSIAAAVKFWD